MNKMIDLFKNAFWYIIEGACTVLLYMLKYVPGVQEAYMRQWPAVDIFNSHQG